jgi:AcrR family transcriptional regulator
MNSKIEPQTEQEQQIQLSAVKERQFKGMSLTQRKQARREKLIEAGIEAYGTHGFFSVTVKDICTEAKLTERYFYESFKKSENLFQTIFLQLVEQLQQTLMKAIMQASPEPIQMIDAGLNAFFSMLEDDPRTARIIYIDAMLVQELHNHATIQETMGRFDRMIHAFVTLMMPHMHLSEKEISLIATGLNGYVTQIAVRWVVGGFNLPREEVVRACKTVFQALLNDLTKK